MSILRDFQRKRETTKHRESRRDKAFLHAIGVTFEEFHMIYQLYDEWCDICSDAGSCHECQIDHDRDYDLDYDYSFAVSDVGCFHYHIWAKYKNKLEVVEKIYVFIDRTICDHILCAECPYCPQQSDCIGEFIRDTAGLLWNEKIMKT